MRIISFVLDSNVGDMLASHSSLISLEFGEMLESSYRLENLEIFQISLTT